MGLTRPSPQVRDQSGVPSLPGITDPRQRNPQGELSSFCETHQLRGRDGFRDPFGHASDLVTLPIGK
jgi:hypothetical protein